MGILNLTPDSFSDGGVYQNPDRAYRRAIEIEEQGADVLDIGGESTRPGAIPVSINDELKRILPVLKKISPKIKIPISIDTRHAEIAHKALQEGVTWVNDISGLSDPQMARVVSDGQATVVLMHMQGEPSTMQNNPQYKNVVEDIMTDLQRKIEVALDTGIQGDKIIIDPGIGFGKSFEHNLELFKHINKFESLGYPIMLGFSRKKMVKVLFGENSEEIKVGNQILNVLAAQKGISWLRVHDVAETKKILNALERMGEIKS